MWFYNILTTERKPTNSTNSHFILKKPREESVILLKTKFFYINFDVVHAADNNRNWNGNSFRLIVLGPIAFFSDYSSTDNCKNCPEEINHAHPESLLKK